MERATSSVRASLTPSQPSARGEGSTRAFGGTLLAHQNVPSSLAKKNLSIVSVRGYGPKKYAAGLVWQQSRVAGGEKLGGVL